MSKVCIIYTGGTIGMIRSENGYVPDSSGLVSMLPTVAELGIPGFPEIDVVEFSPLLDSCNIAVEEWNKLGKCIADRYDDYDGFVVLHGTDTMAYTASALSFMLENLGKPVVFTGAQIPLSEMRSDGRSNLVNSIIIAAGKQINEVSLYFAGKLLRGNRSTKKSSDTFQAFESPNFPPLAEAGIRIRYAQDGLNAQEKPYIGAVNGHDMTTEAAMAKLYYLFSLDISLSDVKQLMSEDLRGELTC